MHARGARALTRCSSASGVVLWCSAHSWRRKKSPEVPEQPSGGTRPYEQRGSVVVRRQWSRDDLRRDSLNGAAHRDYRRLKKYAHMYFGRNDGLGVHPGTSTDHPGHLETA